MSNLFPDKPVFTGFNEPRRVEAEVNDLEVEGEVPVALNGAFYRCGPDPRFPPIHGDDININGDGMVTMFRFDNGAVDFRSRYVRTEKYLLEAKARRALFGVYRNPYTDDPSVAGKDRTTANTNAFFHAGRLFALKEDGLPYEVDPHTLETRGRFDYGGKIESQTHTAHPKIDPASGEMLSHGYEAKGLATRDVSIQVISKTGELVREDFFTAPYVSFMHDWAATANHFIFPMMPTTADDARMRAGGAHWMFEPDLDTWFGILRRDANATDMRWFKSPACGLGHILNAFDDGDKVYVDMTVSERNQFPSIENADGAPFDRDKAAPHLTRLTFDLSKPGDAYEAETLYPDFLEMPIIDARYALHPYRHGFTTVLDRTRPLNVAGTIGVGWNTITHVDLATKKMKRYYVGDRTTCQEPCFVPRSANAPEGDGYLLSVITHYGDNEPRTLLIVLDTADIEAGPIARIRVPFRLHGAVHGNWVSAGDLGSVV